MKKLLPAIACLVILVSCRHEKIEHPTMDEAGKIIDDAEASFTSGDPFRIMEHYAPDAVFFDPAYVEPTRDRAVATKWAESFVALKPTSFSPGKRNIQILSDHLIISSGVATMTITGKNGPEQVRTRYTDVYKQQPDKIWLIVHENLSSVPKPSAETTAN